MIYLKYVSSWIPRDILKLILIIFYINDILGQVNNDKITIFPATPQILLAAINRFFRNIIFSKFKLNQPVLKDIKLKINVPKTMIKKNNNNFRTKQIPMVFWRNINLTVLNTWVPKLTITMSSVLITHILPIDGFSTYQ